MLRSERTSAVVIPPELGPDALHNEDWEIKLGDGPVIATAVHDGHRLRESLRPWLCLPDEDRRREEDPLTGVLATVGDSQVRVRGSRFQCDLNRPRARAFPREPADTWGLEVWNELPPPQEIQLSLRVYDRFHALIRTIVEQTVRSHGHALVLDIHSYNHRRDGAEGAAGDPERNPDIDLGCTEFDRPRYGALAGRFAEALRAVPAAGRRLDVRENIRYEGGGHFPEWLYQTFGRSVCTITLEYKKFFMDEWSSQADVAVLEDLRLGLEQAVAAAKEELACL